jgi:hypothetical protein
MFLLIAAIRQRFFRSDIVLLKSGYLNNTPPKATSVCWVQVTSSGRCCMSSEGFDDPYLIVNMKPFSDHVKRLTKQNFRFPLFCRVV